jgi:hypothetical protein
MQGQTQAAAKETAQAPSQAQLENQAANQQNQNQVNANLQNAQKIPGPAPLGQAVESRHAKAVAGAPAAPAHPAPASSADTTAAMSYQASESLGLTAVSGRRVILAPGSDVVWRPGPAGLIEVSNDRGATWSRQTSGVPTDLLAGSAVTDKICWVVGRAGTVLLTVDGGSQWKLLRPPLSEDLGGIRATDALHATVWNLRRTKSFVTSDGGATWQPVPTP